MNQTRFVLIALAAIGMVAICGGHLLSANKPDDGDGENKDDDTDEEAGSEDSKAGQ